MTNNYTTQLHTKLLRDGNFTLYHHKCQFCQPLTIKEKLISKVRWNLTTGDKYKEYLNRISEFFAALNWYNSSILATFSADSNGLTNNT